MKFVEISPPRRFKVGKSINKIEISHCMSICLEEDEMVTFSENNDNSGYDITRKNWGFYLTQSINQRLSSNGYIVFLIEGKMSKKKFIVSVINSQKCIDSFNKYIYEEDLAIIAKL